MASQNPPKKIDPWQPSQAPALIAGTGFKLPQMPSNLGVKFKDAFQGGLNTLANVGVQQGNPTQLAEEAKAKQRYGKTAPESQFTPEQLAILQKVPTNALPFEKQNAVNALRKNEGMGNALKLGLAGAGLAYVLSGGDMGKVALGGLAGAGAGSLLTRKTALQKLEDYANLQEANKLNEGYAKTIMGQAEDEGATVDALAMGGNLTKNQSLQMKKIVAEMKNPNITAKRYAVLEAMLNKMQQTPMEYAQIKNQQQALAGETTDLGKPKNVGSTKTGGTVEKNRDGSYRAGAKATSPFQVKALGLGGLTGQDIVKYKKELSDTEEQKRQNAIETGLRKQSLGQSAFEAQQRIALEREKMDYTTLENEIKDAIEKRNAIPKPSIIEKTKNPASYAIQMKNYDQQIAKLNAIINAKENERRRLGAKK